MEKIKAMEQCSATGDGDPYLKAALPLRNRLMRAVWGIANAVLFRPSPRPMHAWRAMLLRMFGAKMGSNCHIYAGANIWAPWNLICDEAAAVADGATIYNPKPIRLGSHSIVSQEAYLCGATHDYEDPAFPFVASEIVVGPYAWICARATVQPGVNVGEGAVLGLGAIATRNLEPWTVYAGVPARKVRSRVMRGSVGAHNGEALSAKQAG